MQPEKLLKPDWISEADWLDTLSLMRFMALWIERLYGPRCLKYSKDCPCCQKWQLYDRMFFL